ncbi:MAG: cysteine desulfurase [Planctomycetes bacterium]|nr:cysteine desulfurase [Planctomycetota bacterium]
MRPLYLDYNATTPIAPSVQEAMLPFLAEHFGNPSSTHALGRACREAIEDARSRIAALLGTDPDEIVFTSGGTESNNVAIKGVMLREPPSAGGHLVISAIEHPAVTAPAGWLREWGYGVTVVPCNRQGVVEPERIAEALRPQTRLVSIMHANNETGVVQPIRRIAEICRRAGVLLHTDAAQSVGKIRTHVDELGVDLLTLAGHKVYAPKGIGALYIRSGVAVDPVIHGAGQEAGLRPGTENVPYIVGLGQAALLAHKSLDRSTERMASLRDLLARRLSDPIGPELTINGDGAERLPNTLSVSFPGVVGGELLGRIPELYASTGAACHSDAPEHISATLAAMGLSAEQARGTIRLSVGWYTSEEEIDRAADLLLGAWEALK